MPEPAIPEPLALAKTAGERISQYQERANAWAAVRRDALRQLVADGWSLQKIADQLEVSKTRVAKIVGDRGDDDRLDEQLAAQVAQLTQRTQREPAATDHTPKAPSALQTEQIAALLQTLTELADRLGDPRTPP